MDKKPIISIIVPVYNAEKYIEACIDSILKQSFSDFEVIVIDDGSTDRSAALCDEYAKADSRVKVLHKKNGGVSLARQDGVSMAQGEYLAFVDADDRITEDFMETVTMHTDVDIIRFGYIGERPNGEQTKHFPREREGRYTASDIRKELFPYLIQSESAAYYCPSLWCHVFKKELFVANMVRDCVIKIGEDGACVMPCVYHADSYVCVHKCLYVYNYNDTSATKGGKAFPWDGPQLIANHLAARIDMSELDFRQQLDRKVAHELFLVVVSQFHRDETYRSLRKEIIRELNAPEYKEALKKARFKGSLKAKCMRFFLRHRMISIVYMYSRCRLLRG